MRSTGMRCTRSRESMAGPGAGVVTVLVVEGGGFRFAAVAPKSAPKPRPKAGFVMPPECRRVEELSKRF